MVGSGLVGLFVAAACRESGLGVRVVDRAQPLAPPGASGASGGMLGYRFEWYPPRSGFDLSVAANRRWQVWIERLGGAEAVGLISAGTVWIATGEVAPVEVELAEQSTQGLEAHPLETPAERAEAEVVVPAGGQAWLLSDEWAVDPRRVVRRLLARAEERGIEVLGDEPVLGLSRKGDRIQGVRTPSGVHPAGAVVLATGAWSDASWLAEVGVVPPPIRSVPGQVAFVDRGPTRVVRVLHGGPYVIPRRDGTAVVGATTEGGRVARVEADVLQALLDRARAFVPCLAEARIRGGAAGIRPQTPDKHPVVGPAGPDGLYWATGHGRSGVHLGPLTGEVVAHLVAGTAPGLDLSPWDPARFGR
ncbi:MAG: FAD-dependent oxidoreductase [Deltaproteobacteria bacterium]|nr:MAG: FAD-dependent oxidoreductase [Deltaproteobacteria bacterium]